MKVYITTGSAGLLGSRLSHLLLQKGAAYEKNLH